MPFSRVLLTGSAAVLALLGLAGSFLPAELLGWLGATPAPALLLVVQLLGALALGFAALDWMSRHATAGGLYGRPLVVGNLLHFTSGALAALKLAARAPEVRPLWAVAAVYAVLALGFARAFLRPPTRASSPAEAPGR